MKGLKQYLWKFKGMFLVSVVMIILSALFSVGLAFILQRIIDSTMAMNEKVLFQAIGVGVIYTFLSAFVGVGRKVSTAYMNKKIFIALKEDAFSHLMKRNMKTFNEESTATYLSILTNDMKMIEDSYFNNLFSMIHNIVMFILAVASMIFISPVVTLVIGIVGMLPVCVPLVCGKKLSASREGYSKGLEDFTSKLKDYFNGFEVIKSFHIEEKAKNVYERHNKKVEKSKFKMALLMTLVDEMSMVFGFMMFIVTMGIGSYLVIKGQLTIGFMVAMIQLMNYIVGPITSAAQQMSQLKSIAAIEKKMMRMMDDKLQEDVGEEKGCYEKAIQFSNVSFAYEEERPILNGTELTLEKGKKYAIVGASGSGKSTLLKLLLRYYEDFDGQITIDGVDNRKIKVESLYNLMSVIHQNVFMFDDSIENNIKLYQHYDDKVLEEAIKKAGLMPLIHNLKAGVKESVGEDGNRLSGGERQRIAIARALIKGTPIMVLDEATSSLDNETAYHIEKSILGIEDLTCLVVTHKLNPEMLRQYDEIIVLKNGVVEEKGSFDTLIEEKDYFYSLYNVMAS